ncbi:hypothetical protein JMF89_14740 [Clostridiaceae bacterium UIB06]|nr:hypothetical protein [Clostridiaceae bacterium UIB06]
MSLKRSIYSNNIYVNGLYREMNSKIVEGGTARDYAFMNWIKNSINNCKEIPLSPNRVKNIYRIFTALISKRDFNIIFQYPRIGIPIYSSASIANLYIELVKFAAKNNNIIFDISDIKYEQVIDLNINVNNIEKIKRFENNFFRLPAKFIFAAYSMREYACKKYLLDIENTDVCINGGIENTYSITSPLEKYIEKNKINYIYAGTLNKGRQIEEMISNFPNSEKHNLLLLGSEGEWINNYGLPRNIKYLGGIEEKEAHYLASKCDIGLIPYDESKLYYNIAYPTKLSFYITAGIPFLSTAVNEVKRINQKYGIGFTNEISNWSNVINNITLEQIEDIKTKISNIKEEFYWNTIFSKNKFIR